MAFEPTPDSSSVAVRLGLGHRVRADIAVGAALVLDDDGLAQILASSTASSLPIASVLPPGGNGTTSLTGRVGHCPVCAYSAAGVAAAAATISAASARRRRAGIALRSMYVSSLCAFRRTVST